MTLLVYCLALATFFATCSIGAAVECTVDGSNPWCKCHGTNDGKDFTLDLSKFLSLPLENIQDNENPDVYVYTFSPCSPVDCSNYGDSSGVACQVYTDPSQLGNVFVARNAMQPTWSIQSVSPLEFTVTYCGGDGTGGMEDLERCAAVKLQYDASQSTLAAAMDSETSTDTHLTYNFILKDKSFGGGGGGGGGGVAAGVVGWVLMSIFFAALLAYFIVGIVVNYRRKDARGCEAVPNSAFWKDLPFLIKDGFLFTISPCYKTEKYQKF